MATKSTILRLSLEAINDVGESPDKEFDEQLTLSGYDEVVVRRKKLSNSGADVSLVLSATVIGLIVFAHDFPFSLRLVSGEALVANCRLYVIWADDENDSALTTAEILLTGNSSNDSDLEVWEIVLPS